MSREGPSHEDSHYVAFDVTLTPLTGRRASCSDSRVVFKRMLWMRELKALAEGRPLTDWKVPDYPLYGLPPSE